MREFYGVMSSKNISKGYFFTTSTFHQGALKFASGLNIDLIDGHELLHRFNQLPGESQTRLHEIATEGDYKTPSCASCGRKMVERTNKKTGKPFWACAKYKCKSTLQIKTK
jgi:restriction system protein